MDQKMLRNDQWERIEHLPPGKAGDRGCTAKDNRRFVEAALRVMRTGSPWRDFPAELGHCIAHMFISPAGVKRALGSAWPSRCMVTRTWNTGYSTIVPAQQHSAGAQKKALSQEIGCSRGGLTTKLHVAVDALGNPLRVILSAGQMFNIDCAADLIDQLPTQAVVADKGCDADHFVTKIENSGA